MYHRLCGRRAEATHEECRSWPRDSDEPAWSCAGDCKCEPSRRNRNRGWLDDCAGTNAHADEYADADTNAHTNQYPDVYQYSNEDVDTDADQYADKHADAYTNANTDTDSAADPDAAANSSGSFANFTGRDPTDSGFEPVDRMDAAARWTRNEVAVSRNSTDH